MKRLSGHDAVVTRNMSETAEAVVVASSMSALESAHQPFAEDVQHAQKRSKNERVASYQMVRAWDHALELGDVGGLRAFLPGPEELGDFGGDEVRYFCEQSLWDDYEVPDGVPWMRGCVAKAHGDERWHEVPARYANGLPPVLTISSDECAVNLSAYQFLAHELGARAVLLRDQAHRTWRDFRLALTESNLWPTVLELMHAMNCRHGPWQSQAWFRQILESVNLHVQKVGAGCPLFHALASRIAADANFRRPCEPESVAELALVWKRVQELESRGKKGTRVNTTRWFEFLTAYAAFERDFHTHLYEYCLVLFHTGVATRLVDFPI